MMELVNFGDSKYINENEDGSTVENEVSTMNNKIYSLRISRPKSILISAASMSGKTKLLQSILSNPQLYFSFCSKEDEGITQITIFTHELSKKSWENFLINNFFKEKYSIFTYQEIVGENNLDEAWTSKMAQIAKNSIVICDDLSSNHFLKLKSLIFSLIDVGVHHKSLILYLVIQGFMDNSLKYIIPKINDIYISTTHQSSFRSVKYLGIIHFSKEDRQKLVDALILSKKLKENFVIVRMKNNNFNPNSSNIIAIVNFFGYISSQDIFRPPIFIVNNQEGQEEYCGIIDLYKNQKHSNNLALKSPENNEICFTNLDKLTESLSKSISSDSTFNNFKSIMEKDQFILIPKSVFDKTMIDIKKKSEEEMDESIPTENEMDNKLKLRFEDLKRNIDGMLSLYVGPKKVLPCKRIAHDLLECKFFSFIGVSGRCFYINFIPNEVSLKTMQLLNKNKVDPYNSRIKTIDFLISVTRRPAPKNILQRNPFKIIPIYKLVVDMLILKDTPSSLIINNLYL